MLLRYSPGSTVCASSLPGTGLKHKRRATLRHARDCGCRWRSDRLLLQPGRRCSNAQEVNNVGGQHLLGPHHRVPDHGAAGVKREPCNRNAPIGKVLIDLMKQTARVWLTRRRDNVVLSIFSTVCSLLIVLGNGRFYRGCRGASSAGARCQYYQERNVSGGELLPILMLNSE